MQTTVKHTPGQVVLYLGVGNRAYELRLFPWKSRRFTALHKRTISPKPQPAQASPAPDPLPGFVEPEHPPQTTTCVAGK